MTEAIRFIDLFAGIGGMRIPFEELGGRCVFTSEVDTWAAKVYSANFGETPQGDITRIPSEDIPDHDVLLAGFPCQAFSVLGKKRGFQDPRGTLFFEIQRILDHCRPIAFVLENVPNLIGHDHGRTMQTIMGILQGHAMPFAKAGISTKTKLNYAVHYKVLFARNFGLPQNRPRVFLVGLDRDRLRSTGFGTDVPARILQAVDGLHKPETRLGSILERNGDIDSGYTLTRDEIERLEDFERRYKVRHGFNSHSDFFTTIHGPDDRYIRTLVQNSLYVKRKVLVDQNDIDRLPRMFTPREAARLQGFPESYAVEAVPHDRFGWCIGNSVAVPVVRAIARELVPYLA